MPLDDDRWHDLETAYRGSCDDLITRLSDAYVGDFIEDFLGVTVNEVAHQGDHSDSIFAVVPHFVRLSRVCRDARSLDLLIQAGLMCQIADELPCPAPVEDEYRMAREIGLADLRDRLSAQLDQDAFRYALGATAGFAGYGRLTDILDKFEFLEVDECCPTCGRYVGLD